MVHWRSIVAAIAVLAMTARVQAGAPSGDSAERRPLPPPGSRSTERPVTAIQTSLPKTIVVLGGLLVGVVVVLAVVRRLVPGVARKTPAGLLQVLGQTPLGSGATMYVVRCGPRVLIVGSTATHVTALAEIADPDEIDQFARTSAHGPAESRVRGAIGTTQESSGIGTLKGQVDELLDKVGSWKA